MKIISFSLIAFIFVSCFQHPPTAARELTKSELTDAKANWASLEEALNRSALRKDSFVGKSVWFEGHTSAHWVFSKPKEVRIELLSKSLCVVDFIHAYTEPKEQWLADNYKVFVFGKVTSIDRNNRKVKVRAQYAGVLSSQ